MDDGTRENHSSSNFNIFLPPARHQHQPPGNLRGHRVLKRLIITSRKCVASSSVAGRVNLEDNFIGLGAGGVAAIGQVWEEGCCSVNTVTQSHTRLPALVLTSYWPL